MPQVGLAHEDRQPQCWTVQSHHTPPVPADPPPADPPAAGPPLVILVTQAVPGRTTSTRRATVVRPLTGTRPLTVVRPLTSTRRTTSSRRIVTRRVVARHDVVPVRTHRPAHHQPERRCRQAGGDARRQVPRGGSRVPVDGELVNPRDDGRERRQGTAEAGPEQRPDHPRRGHHLDHQNKQQGEHERAHRVHRERRPGKPVRRRRPPRGHRVPGQAANAAAREHHRHHRGPHPWPPTPPGTRERIGGTVRVHDRVGVSSRCRGPGLPCGVGLPCCVGWSRGAE